MKQGLLLAVIGSGVGMIGVLGLNRLIASLLFGIQPTDFMTVMLVIATTIAVAAVACWLPAWRAARLDPNTVLREN